MELIDKSALVAEIEKFMYEANQEADIASTGECFDEKVADAKYQLCKQIKESIDSLEMKEEVLDENGKSKLMQKCVKTAYKRGYDMGVLQTTNKINHNTKEINIVEMADDYYDALMKEAADWMDEGTMGHCRLAYYNGCKDVLNKIQKGE